METCPARFRLLFIHTMQKKQQIRNSTAEFLIFAMQGDAEGIEVRLEDDTVWLTQQMLASLYGSSRTNVLEHIQHIYADEELEESATCRKIRQVQKEGNRNVNRETLCKGVISSTVRYLQMFLGPSMGVESFNVL